MKARRKAHMCRIVPEIPLKRRSSHCLLYNVQFPGYMPPVCMGFHFKPVQEFLVSTSGDQAFMAESTQWQVFAACLGKGCVANVREQALEHVIEYSHALLSCQGERCGSSTSQKLQLGMNSALNRHNSGLHQYAWACLCMHVRTCMHKQPRRGLVPAGLTLMFETILSISAQESVGGQVYQAWVRRCCVLILVYQAVQVTGDQIILHLFQPHQAAVMLALFCESS